MVLLNKQGLLEDNQIVCGDSETYLRDSVKPNSVDLVITSPPYNLKSPKINYDQYPDTKEYADYMLWLLRIFDGAMGVMKDGARLCVNISDPKNGAIATHVHLQHYLCYAGFNYYTTLVWDKHQLGSSTAWGSFKSPSCPSFPTQWEYILVFYKGANRKLPEKGETDLTKEEFIEWSRGLWRFPPETRSRKKFGHPAAFPEELPRRLIKMLSWKDALVLDPFNGVGTTTLVAHQLSRRYLGFDISEDYCEVARRRIEEDGIHGG